MLAEGATLPAISNSVAALKGAAGNTATLSPLGVWSTGIGIAGSLAGLLLADDPIVAASLGIASYVIGMIPSATPDLDGPSFSGTVVDLQNKFANAVTGEDNAQIEQNLEVRENWGLLRLVGGLTAPSGAWHNIDFAGLEHAMEEGYAVYLYKKLLPTMVDRYVISKCIPGAEKDSPVDCNYTDSLGSLSASGNDGVSFTTLMAPPVGHGDTATDFPCYYNDDFGPETCHYDRPVSPDVANQLWGKPSDTCVYNGNPETLWRYDCSLGVSPAESTGLSDGEATGWHFTTCTGTPVVDPFTSGKYCSTSGTATSDGTVQLSLSAALPAGFEIQSATLPANHALYQPGEGDLLSPAPTDSDGQGLTSGAPGDLGAIHLTVTKADAADEGSGGDELLSSSSDGADASLTVHDDGTSVGTSQTTTMDLKLSGVKIAIPTACQQVPASVSLDSPQFTLETSIEVSDSDSTHTVTIPTIWKCVRDDSGNITELRTVKQPVPVQRPGLELAVQGPQTVRPGSVMEERISVQNARDRSRHRDVSSLWNVETDAALDPTDLPSGERVDSRHLIVRHVGELRARSRRTLRVPIRIPARLRTSGSRRVCVSVIATAESAKAQTATTCAILRLHHGRHGG